MRRNDDPASAAASPRRRNNTSVRICRAFPHQRSATCESVILVKNPLVTCHRRARVLSRRVFNSCTLSTMSATASKACTVFVATSSRVEERYGCRTGGLGSITIQQPAEVFLSYRTLVQLFGAPNSRDDPDKTDVSWDLTSKHGGVHVCEHVGGGHGRMRAAEGSSLSSCPPPLQTTGRTDPITRARARSTTSTRSTCAATRRLPWTRSWRSVARPPPRTRRSEASRW